MATAGVRACLLTLGLVWALVAQTAQAEEPKRYVVEGSRAATLDACVEPTERMRRQHMELIKHPRADAVHKGIRTSKYSLTGCVACHVSYDEVRHPRPVNGKDQFCGACHAFAAVRVPCFDCHAAVPNGSRIDADARAAHEAAGLGTQIQIGRDGEGQPHE